MLNPQIKEGTVINDRYEITGKLGDGGFASVFRARDLDLGRDVAIKILKMSVSGAESERERFLREARTLAQLQHDNIIRCFAVDLSESGSPLIVMELLKGKTLQDFIKENSKLNWETCSSIFSQICLALSYAHEKGVLHRDLSSSNVFILDGTDLKVKVIDFGLAKALQGEGTKTDSSHLTKTGMVVGNPSYMSPEQCRGQKLDPRSDIYSLGCVLYESLCGKAPFENASPLSILAAHQSDYPEAPEFSWQNKALEKYAKAIILKCLQKKPEQRFQSADELLLCLRDPESAEIKSVLNPGLSWGVLKSGKRSTKTTLAIGICSALILLALCANDKAQLFLLKAVISLHSPVLVNLEKSIADGFAEKLPESAAMVYEEILSQKDLPKKTIVSISLSLADIYERRGQQSKIPALLLTALAKTAGSSEWDRTEMSKAFNLLNSPELKSTPTSAEIEARCKLLESALKLGQRNRSMVDSMCQKTLLRLYEYIRLNKAEYSLLQEVSRCLTETFKTFPIQFSETNTFKAIQFAKICPMEAAKMYKALANNRASRRDQADLAMTELVSALTEFDKPAALKAIQKFLPKVEGESRVQLLVAAASLCAENGDLPSALNYSKEAVRFQEELCSEYSDLQKDTDISTLLEAYKQKARVYELMHEPKEVKKVCQRAYLWLPGVKKLEEEDPIPIYLSTTELINRKTITVGDSWKTHLLYYHVLSLFADCNDNGLMESALTNYRYILRKYPRNCYIGTRHDFGIGHWRTQIEGMRSFCKQLSLDKNTGPELKRLLEECAELCDKNLKSS